MEVDKINAELTQQMTELCMPRQTPKTLLILQAAAAVCVIVAAGAFFSASKSVMPSDVLEDNQLLHEKVDRLESLLEVKPADVMRETQVLQSKVDELTQKIEQLGE